jgi:hypothetical protein
MLRFVTVPVQSTIAEADAEANREHASNGAASRLTVMFFGTLMVFPFCRYLAHHHM